MYPLAARRSESDEKVCYSFVFCPKMARPKFLERTARILGCNPNEHFKKLIEGETVTLDDGTVVTPSMVMGMPTKA